MNPMQEKSLLRKRYADIRQGLSDADRAAWSKEIYDKLYALPAWQNANILCAYVSIRGELDTTPIIRQALREGKRVALPCTLTDAHEGRMIFRILSSDDLGVLQKQRFGIPEPDATCAELSTSDLAQAVMLLPALAFDLDGYRLGYGGGYYDRFLGKARQEGYAPATVGLAFSPLVADTLPHDAYDIPAHIIITERSVHLTHGTG